MVAGEIKGEKENGIRLMEEAAHQGNIQALSSLGIIFADGSDISYDCKRATQYFSD